ncbi:hypothetical protein GX51_02543 [Blastomyces parvus]|uniref:Uncharacterized protein n=1 Tax=Blastomyces parvus TaxID=2060905 RepID=A0A2B7XAZ6_9EURO|nr:hypothetical protein GX51_02543 [Blastomyces parvus]
MLDHDTTHSSISTAHTLPTFNMKLTTLFTSACLVVAAIATPIMQLEPVDSVDVNVTALSQSPNPANIDMHQLHFPPPLRWRPSVRLLDEALRQFTFPSYGTGGQFAQYLIFECMNIPRCQSLAGFKDRGGWLGYVFKVTITTNDFVSTSMTTDSFAFTT